MRRVFAALLATAATFGIFTGTAGAVFPGGNGKIAFSKAGVGGQPDIWTVNPDGSGLVNLTMSSGYQDTTPVWSPDRERIAFIRYDGSSLRRVYMMNASGSEPRPVPGTCSEPKDPAWSPDGTKLALACDYAGYDDIALLNVDGSGATRITSTFEVHDRFPAWSPDGTQLSWVKGSDIWKMNADGSGQTLLVDHPNIYVSSLTWSPDGTQLAFTRHCNCPKSDIWRMQADGTGLIRLGNTPDLVERVTWSPDGTRLLYDSCVHATTGGCPGLALWTMSTDGTDLQEVPGDGDAEARAADWQVAGPPYVDPPAAFGQIAFMAARDHLDRFNESWDDEIYTMNPDGSRQRRLTSNLWGDRNPAWSPNGTKIAFSSNPDGGNANRYEIHVMNADGSGDVGLTDNPTGTNDLSPTWSPDGTRIAFTRVDDESPPLYRVMVMNADGSGLHEISANGDDPDWSPDGEWIAFVSSGDISKMRPDGSDVTLLATGNVSAPNWSHDGHHIAFNRFEPSPSGGSQANVWHMDANGDFETQYTYHDGGAGFPTWAPDGRAIAYSWQLDIWRAGGGVVNLTNQPGSDDYPDWQAIPGYPRPATAGQVRFSLVPAHQTCASANRTHGSPLAHPSCTPPVAASTYLTVATPEVNGAPVAFEGYLRVKALSGTPAAPPDEADAGLELAVNDVRCNGPSPPSTCGAANSSSTGHDYTGELDVVVFLRITDKLSKSALTNLGPATVQDFDLHFSVPCSGTASTALGSNCTTVTTVEALMPGAITEGKRSVWELDRVHVRDGGADGDAETAGNRIFLRPGLFVP